MTTGSLGRLCRSRPGLPVIVALSVAGLCLADSAATTIVGVAVLLTVLVRISMIVGRTHERTAR